MIRGSFLARRAASSRLLLSTIMLTVLVTAALGAALATFSALSLPQAVRTQLTRSPDLSIAVSGAMSGAQAASASSVIGRALGGALTGVPYRLDRALWSDPLGLPAPPPSAVTPLVEVAAVDQIAAHAGLASGRWPGPARPGQPLGVALPVLAAQQLHARPGTILPARDRITNARVPLLVTGLYRPRDPGSGYWGIDLIGQSGISSQPPFVSYGPAVASPAAFGPGGLTVSKASWITLPDATRIRDGDLTSLASRVSQAVAFLQGLNSLGGVDVSTGLPSLLSGLASNLVVARSLLIIGALELVLLAAAALALAARLLAGHREEESALLRARGATRWQLAGPSLAEALLVGGAAAAAGVLAGTRLATLVVRITQPGTGVTRSAIPASAWWAAAAALALAVVIVLWPAMRPAATGVVRVRRGRQAALAGVARGGVDVALLALAALAVWCCGTSWL